MKGIQFTFTIAILVVCLPTIAYSKPIQVEAGNVRIIQEPNGRIQVNTGNTQISVPRQSIQKEIDVYYPLDEEEFNSSTSQQTTHTTYCGTRSVQSHQQSRVRGSRQTIRQTNISTNICQ